MADVIIPTNHSGALQTTIKRRKLNATLRLSKLISKILIWWKLPKPVRQNSRNVATCMEIHGLGGFCKTFLVTGGGGGGGGGWMKIMRVLRTLSMSFNRNYPHCRYTHSDILPSLGDDKVAVAEMTLLDLFAGFGTIDYSILLSGLDGCFGVTGRALDWF